MNVKEYREKFSQIVSHEQGLVRWLVVRILPARGARAGGLQLLCDALCQGWLMRSGLSGRALISAQASAGLRKVLASLLHQRQQLGRWQ
jgi:hypothetical protein